MKKKMKKKVMVGGTFDILHTGHLEFLKFAKKQANPSELIVVIARDATVEKRRGHAPLFGEKERKKLVESLEVVDKAVLGNPPGEYGIFHIISSINPHVIVLGYDQPFKEDKLEEWAEKHGLNFHVLRAKKFNIEGISSSSEVRERVRRLGDGEE